MTWFLFFPFIAQAVALAVDEARFHRRRSLPRWERLARPFDTAMMLVCLAYLLLLPYSMPALKLYLVMVLLSGVAATRSAWMHTPSCGAVEGWLHALVLVLHPMVLLSAAVMWPVISSQDVISTIALLYMMDLQKSASVLHHFLVAQFLLVLGYLVFQVYWNIDRRFDQEVRRARSTRKLVAGTTLSDAARKPGDDA